MTLYDIGVKRNDFPTGLTVRDLVKQIDNLYFKTILHVFWYLLQPNIKGLGRGSQNFWYADHLEKFGGPRSTHNWFE